MKEKKIGELGYEGISWTKSRVRCYKLDEVQKREEENRGISWTKSRGKNKKRKQMVTKFYKKLSGE